MTGAAVKSVAAASGAADLPKALAHIWVRGLAVDFKTRGGTQRVLDDIYIGVKLPRRKRLGFGAYLTALPCPRRSDSRGLTMARHR